jgi:hypothetical protein
MFGVAGNRLPKWMLASALERQELAQELFFMTSVHYCQVPDAWFSQSQDARLVKCHDLQTGNRFEKCPSLNEDSSGCGGAKRGCQGDRCRDHESAGAGDHEYDHSLVEPMAIVAADEARHYGDQQAMLMTHGV